MEKNGGCERSRHGPQLDGTIWLEQASVNDRRAGVIDLGPALVRVRTAIQLSGRNSVRNRRTILVILTAITLLLQGTIALADDPIIPSIPYMDPHDPKWQPAPEVRPILAVKHAQTEIWLAQQRAFLAKACPTGTCTDAGVGGGTYPYSMTLHVLAFQQQYCNWCGPATTQAVQYYRNGGYDTQSTIASYSGTCFPPYTCGTIVGNDVTASNHFVSLPSGFAYEWYTTSSGGDWWGKLQTDIYGYFMPQVVTVAPHDSDSTLYLPSWPTAVTNPPGAGHYVAVDGYTGYNFSGGSVHYTDSSANCVGSTGSYSTTSDTMYYTILKSNQNHAGNYIIW